MPEAVDERPRGWRGRYARARETAERDAVACEMRSRGMTYRQIAAELEVNAASAHEMVRRALRAIVEEPAADLIRLEATRLDTLYAEALEVLERDHVVVSHGRIVCGEDGTPLRDDTPKLQAIDRLVKIRESFRKLHGLDAETKVNVSGGVRYEIVGVDMAKLQ